MRILTYSATIIQLEEALKEDEVKEWLNGNGVEVIQRDVFSYSLQVKS